MIRPTVAGRGGIMIIYLWGSTRNVLILVVLGMDVALLIQLERAIG